MIDRLLSMFGFLVKNPLGFLLYFVNLACALLLTLVMHEFAHAYVAFKCGDPTAKMFGRLTLNPLKHLDPVGTVCMLFLGFGWAKPVPINPRNFKNAWQDDFFVSIAGITMNLSLFLISTALMIALHKFVWTPQVIQVYGNMQLLSSNGLGFAYLLNTGLLNDALVINNTVLAYVQRFLILFARFNLMVSIFNFLPVPPLDGYHIFNDLIFKGKLRMQGNMITIVHALFLILMFSGTLGKVLSTVVGYIETGVLNTLLKVVGAA